MGLNMADLEILKSKYREPLNPAYCAEVNCQLRSGKKCTVAECARAGAEKRAIYFTEHGHLADGDEIDA